MCARSIEPRISALNGRGVKPVKKRALRHPEPSGLLNSRNGALSRDTTGDAVDHSDHGPAANPGNRI